MVFSFNLTVKAENLSLPLIAQDLTSRLSSYGEKIKIDYTTDKLTLSFQEDENLATKVDLKLDSNLLVYEYVAPVGEQELFIRESLMKNFLLENVLNSIGHLRGYSEENLKNFYEKMPIQQADLNNQGILVVDEKYEYVPFSLEGKGDIEINVLLENIDNFGHGNDTYQLVENIPHLGYSYSLEKSKCLNESTVKFIEDDQAQNIIQVSANRNDVCQIYFDENNLFNYDLNLNAGLIKNLSVDLNKFNPTNLTVNKPEENKDSKEEENPNTGAFIPVIIVFLGLATTIGIFYLTKYRTKIFKI